MHSHNCYEPVACIIISFKLTSIQAEPNAESPGKHVEMKERCWYFIAKKNVF